jgi:hypothetical protein
MKNKQQEDWVKRFKIVKELQGWNLSMMDEEEILSLIQTLINFAILKEREKCNKEMREMIGKKEKPPAYSKNPMGNFATEVRNAYRKELLDQLDKLQVKKEV